MFQLFKNFIKFLEIPRPFCLEKGAVAFVMGIQLCNGDLLFFHGVWLLVLVDDEVLEGGKWEWRGKGGWAGRGEHRERGCQIERWVRRVRL